MEPTSILMNSALEEKTQYHYKKLETLNTIRLLALLPGNPDDLLQGHVFHYLQDASQPAGSKVGYIALSYFWGGDEKPSVLHTVAGSISITASLDSALRAVRPSKDSTGPNDRVDLYWIDAICINQDDNLEKSHQVRRMREIYANAAFVTAYLGGEGGSDKSLDLLCELAKVERRDIQKFNDSHHWDEALDFFNRSGETEIGLPFGTDPAWEGVRALFRRPWFRRVWIIQEFVVARYIVLLCGRRAIPWEVLSSAIPAYDGEWAPLVSYGFPDEETRKATDEGMRSWHAISWLRRVYQGGQKLTFLNLAAILGRTQATKARDHYFGLLGLASDAESQILDPDYDEPLDKIVRRYCAYFIERDNSLIQLYYGGLSSDPRFPSWAPDWTKTHVAPLGITNYCHAGGETKVNAHYDSGEDLLLVSGGFVDEITDLGEVHNLSENLATATDALHTLFCSADNLSKNWSSYPNGGEISDVVARTLIFDSPYESVNDAYQLLRQVVRCAVADNMAFNFLLEHLAIPLWGVGLRELAYRQDWEQYFARLLKTMKNQKLFATRRGYLGVAVTNVQIGDSINILYGTKTPFILRKSSVRENASRLICSCYVHGLMNGEGLEQECFREEQVRLH